MLNNRRKYTFFIYKMRRSAQFRFSFLEAPWKRDRSGEVYMKRKLVRVVHTSNNGVDPVVLFSQLN